MLEVKNVDIMISTRYIIKSLSFTLKKQDKLAIIGEEGNGKSTLLKTLLGICEYAKVNGIIDFHGYKVGYLEQSMSKDAFGKIVFDYLFQDEEDYYNKINQFYKHLIVLQLEDSILKQVIIALCGGVLVNSGLLKLLLEENDILFLDEPTNDLDIETLEWLEEFILKFNGPVIYVSHDETLLSRTANMILHLEQLKKKQECKHTLVRMDYDSYIENRLHLIDRQAQVSKAEKRAYDKKQEKLMQIMQKVEYQQNTISRKDPFGAKLLKKKMHSLKAQEKRLEEKPLTEYPDVEESIHFFFEPVTIPKQKIILKVMIPKLVAHKKVLSHNIKFDIIGNTHLCITGKNGVGKTTLLKEIYQNLKMRQDLNAGYMPQNYEEILEGYDTVLDFIASKEKQEIEHARMFLGNMNFTKEEMTGSLKDLSNGTKAKLFLIKLVLNKCDVLILDEPTRNVSPLSNPVIRNVLTTFNGCIISVSHDRKFIEEVINEHYLLTKDGMIKLN